MCVISRRLGKPLVFALVCARSTTTTTPASSSFTSSSKVRASISRTQYKVQPRKKTQRKKETKKKEEDVLTLYMFRVLNLL